MASRLILIAAAMSALTACSLVALPGCASKPQRVEEAERMRRIGPAGITPEEIQSEVMTATDLYLGRVVPAIDLIARTATDPEERAFARNAMVHVGQSALTIGSSANPVVGLLDLALLVKLQRRSVEAAWIPDRLGERGEPLLAALRQSEQRVWDIVAKALTEQQIDELKRLAERLEEEFGAGTNLAWVRASEFAGARQRSIVAERGSGSLFALFRVDPLAGLSPAAQEIALTRLLAERAFYYTKRLSLVLGWQIEAVFATILADPGYLEAKQIADRAATAAESAAQSVRELPEVVASEREAILAEARDIITTERTAAIDQAFEGVARERKALLDALDEQEEGLSELSRELKTTIDAAERMARAADNAMQSGEQMADAFGRLKVPREPGEPQPPPFDINEYKAAVESADQAILRLDELVGSVKDLLAAPAWSDRAEQVDAVVEDGARLIDRIFYRALTLGLALVAAVFIAALLYRRLTRSPAA